MGNPPGAWSGFLLPVLRRHLLWRSSITKWAMTVEIAGWMLSKPLALAKRKGEGATPEVILGGIPSQASLPGPSSEDILGSVGLGCIEEDRLRDSKLYPAWTLLPLRRPEDCHSVLAWRPGACVLIPALCEGGHVPCQLQVLEPSLLNSTNIYGVHRMCQTLWIKRGRGNLNGFCCCFQSGSLDH